MSSLLAIVLVEVPPMQLLGGDPDDAALLLRLRSKIILVV